jgi:hypothetical protein
MESLNTIHLKRRRNTKSKDKKKNISGCQAGRPYGRELLLRKTPKQVFIIENRINIIYPILGLEL